MNRMDEHTAENRGHIENSDKESFFEQKKSVSNYKSVFNDDETNYESLWSNTLQHK